MATCPSLAGPHRDVLIRQPQLEAAGPGVDCEHAHPDDSRRQWTLPIGPRRRAAARSFPALVPACRRHFQLAPSLSSSASCVPAGRRWRQLGRGPLWRSVRFLPSVGNQRQPRALPRHVLNLLAAWLTAQVLHAQDPWAVWAGPRDAAVGVLFVLF